MLDYGSGNLHSAARALDAAGARVCVSADPEVLRRLDALVVPGVGAFASCITGLAAVGGVELVRDWVARRRPLLAICVGHQVLFSRGLEHGGSVDGIGVYDGDVTRVSARRLPHMGWNTVEAAGTSRMFRGVATDRFYFVHSYAAHAAPVGTLTSYAEHGGTRFVAAVEHETTWSTQFHPEKSGRSGARLIANWLEFVG